MPSWLMVTMPPYSLLEYSTSTFFSHSSFLCALTSQNTKRRNNGDFALRTGFVQVVTGPSFRFRDWSLSEQIVQARNT